MDMTISEGSRYKADLHSEMQNRSVRFDESIAEEQSDDNSSQNEIEMNFTLAKYLPHAAAIQTSFEMIVGGKVYSGFETRIELEQNFNCILTKL